MSQHISKKRRPNNDKDITIDLHATKRALQLKKQLQHNNRIQSHHNPYVQFNPPYGDEVDDVDDNSHDTVYDGTHDSDNELVDENDRYELLAGGDDGDGVDDDGTTNNNKTKFKKDSTVQPIEYNANDSFYQRHQLCCRLDSDVINSMTTNRYQLVDISTEPTCDSFNTNEILYYNGSSDTVPQFHQSFNQLNLHASIIQHLTQQSTAGKLPDIGIDTSDPQNIRFESKLSNGLYTLFNTYSDILYTNRTLDTHHDICVAYCTHVVNHVIKKRAMIHNHTQLIQKDSHNEYTDQGYTRPSVLILVPFANTAYRVVNTLLSLTPATNKRRILNYQKYIDIYQVENEKEKQNNRSASYKHLFDGNNNDCIRLGIKYDTNQIVLYSNFDYSDIIIGTPLGLKMLLYNDNNGELKQNDYLSSIEIVISEQSHCYLQQNYSHYQSVIHALNKIPYETKMTDFSRIYPLYLNTLGSYIRQNIVISDYNSLQISNDYDSLLHNIYHKYKLRSLYTNQLSQLTTTNLTQIYQMIACNDIASTAELRYEYFVKNLLPKFRLSYSNSDHMFSQPYTVLYTNNYYDFIRLRNVLHDKHINYTQINEYSRNSEIIRNLNYFKSGEKRILLCNERWQFFKRYKIHHMCNIIYYNLPQNTEFYLTNINDLVSPNNQQKHIIYVLYDKYDWMLLERLIGTEKAKNMISSAKQTHYIS